MRALHSRMAGGRGPGDRLNPLLFQGLGRLIVAGLILGSAAGRAEAQAELRNPTQPILVFNSGGHSAPIYALIFTADGSQLLSGGMDKIVNVWNLQDEDGPRLARTLRPPIWRGLSGAIFAMALSPKSDNRQQRLLAVAGYGVESQRGNIALYRFPGLEHAETGDILAQLPCGNRAEAETPGHFNSIRALAFDPTGQFLASGSHDQTIRLWDVAARKTIAVLRGHSGAVTALGFAFKGQRLLSAGADGSLILWDVRPERLRDLARQTAQAADAAARARVAADFERRSLLAKADPNPRFRRADDPAGDAINALAVRPDGRQVVVGRENGHLILYDCDGNTLRQQAFLPTAPTQGAVEALAFSPDGRTLAVSLLSQRLVHWSDRPSPRCDLEIRPGPEFRTVRKLATESNVARALAFRPDGRALAYAGGDAQAVVIRDLTNLSAPALRLAGQGTSLWDVGFRRDGKAVGFSRTKADGPNSPGRYWGFDLLQHAIVSLDRDELERGRAIRGDWSIRPVNPTSLEVINTKTNIRHALPLGVLDGRWWSYSFVPPNPSHPKLTIAVGTDAGVIFFVFDAKRGAYRRSRFFAGHSGSVYTLAPSPDGRWLATGSADQTLRLWRLDGCDTLPPLGASFEVGVGGPWTVTAVEPLSFAEAMGLQKGDIIEKAYVKTHEVKPSEFAVKVAAIDPGEKIEFVIRRGDQTILMETTRRDHPALSLFPGTNREWVLWMPHGYYDTSIAGDRRFLGWHRNGSKADGGLDIERPSDYFTIDKYESELRQPKVLDRLIETADLGQALSLVAAPVRDPIAVVRQNLPPAVAITEPARVPDRRLVTRSSALTLRAQARAEEWPVERRLIRNLRVLIDTQKVTDLVFDPPRPEIDQRIPLTLPSGVHRINVIATNDGGKERTKSFVVDNQEPPSPQPTPEVPVPRVPRLVVVSIGAGYFPNNPQIPSIDFAAQDAKDVGQFLADKQNHKFPKVERHILPDPAAGQPADSARLRALFDALKPGDGPDALGAGDTVILMLEAHVLNLDEGDYLVPTDAGSGMPPSESISAAKVGERLGTLAEAGCRVLVLLDGVHEAKSPPSGWTSRASEWARDLYRKNVIIFIASIQGPSFRASAQAHGAFAQGILDARTARAGMRRVSRHDTPLTLDDFRAAVVRRVEQLTSRRQVAELYVPGTLPGSRITLFEPPAPQP
jgi:WD40 repeat protein